MKVATQRTVNRGDVPPELVERAATVFIERLDRLLEQDLRLAEAKSIAMVVALATIDDEPDVEHWTPLILAVLDRRARSHSAPRLYSRNSLMVARA
jgi:hypothetical protein